MATAKGPMKPVRATEVCGSTVYNSLGDAMGTIEDVILDKTSNKIMFAVIGLDGFLGIGEKYHAVPWSVIDYDAIKGGYVIPLTTDVLKSGPTYNIDDLTRNDGDVRDQIYSYYRVTPDWTSAAAGV